MLSTISIRTKPSSKHLGLGIGLLIFCSFLIVCSGVAMYHPLQWSAVSHVLFPIGVMSLVGMETKFGYVKLSSLVAARLSILLACVGYGETSIGFLFTVIVAVNIFEAMVMDALKRMYHNVVVGGLLIGTLFLIPMSWTGQYVNMEHAGTLYWVLAYTIWNWQVALNHAEAPYSVGHIPVLLAPSVWCMVQGDVGPWLMMRELTLSLGIATLAIGRERLKSSVYQVITPEQFVRLRQWVFAPKIQWLSLLICTGLLLLQCSSGT